MGAKEGGGFLMQFSSQNPAMKKNITTSPKKTCKVVYGIWLFC